MRRRSAARVFGCASVLLSYPGEGLGEDLTAVRTAAASLPGGRVRSGLEEVAVWLGGLAPTRAAQVYVETFDLHREVGLHLSYYRYGDTRERGTALTALIDVYRSVGVLLVPGELPDHLPALLELAAIHPAGAEVLAEYRGSLDALHGSLARLHSPYAAAVASVTGVLPGPSRAQREVLVRYRAQGPPSEEVGLEPFGPPEVIMKGLTRR